MQTSVRQHRGHLEAERMRTGFPLWNF